MKEEEATSQAEYGAGTMVVDTARCAFRGGPLDGSWLPSVPKVSRGLPPEYLEIGPNDDEDDRPALLYQRAGTRPESGTGRTEVWAYDFDAEATRDPSTVGSG